jgi:hypothetical protein
VLQVDLGITSEVEMTLGFKTIERFKVLNPSGEVNGVSPFTSD